ncbi:hypothetical protein GN156_09235 [bacterium LRH843]|nr:hypothetical protein [bacterium LRH843]
MSYVASFDIGTTSIKAIVINIHGVLSEKASYELQTIHGPNGEMEQNPNDWWNGIITISNYWWDECGVDPQKVKAITFCGQMQDVIPIPKDETDIPNAILYSDSRAGEEAELLNKMLPNIKEVTGNHIDAASPFAKLLLLKNKCQSLYTNSSSFLFSAKDFIIYQLANVFATDPVTGATTGLMNGRERDWELEWLELTGISQDKLPEINAPEDIVGTVHSEAAKITGFTCGTPVLCGSGDAGATTLGAGSVNCGDDYIYMGTTGWVAVLSDKIEKLQFGIFNLAHLPKERYISIAPLLNVGNVHAWVTQTLTETNDYRDFERLVEEAAAGSNGLLFLPYIHGERFPVNDPEATGVYVGMTPSTTRADMARAVLEGLCFSYRQTYEMLVTDSKDTITLIGGGTKSEAWCQILATVLGKQVRIPGNSEYLAALGAASSAFIALDWAQDYETFVETYLHSNTECLYDPDPVEKESYDNLYERFVKLYPAVRKLYN